MNRNAAAAPPMFEPTHEWKEILPNQVLPAVRATLKTSSLFARCYCSLTRALLSAGSPHPREPADRQKEAKLLD